MEKKHFCTTFALDFDENYYHFVLPTNAALLHSFGQKQKLLVDF